MKTTENTVLITGGSAGIGLEMARQFIALGNKVIITGRDSGRLETALSELGERATAIPLDVTNKNDVDVLTERIKNEYPQLNIVVNNAGQAFIHSLSDAENTFSKANEEMMTNYLAIVCLTEKLLPVLHNHKEAAIVNVSSIVAFAPSNSLPTYSASKAALHSYTKSLRLSLSNSNIKVFELMPPLVNTQFSALIGGERGLAPSVLVADMLDAMASGRYEIRTGDTEQIYQLSLASPEEALMAMNS